MTHCDTNDREWFCGCCGRPCEPWRMWCVDCQTHVKPDIKTAPEHRTYFAQHGEDCPILVKASQAEERMKAEVAELTTKINAYTQTDGNRLLTDAEILARFEGMLHPPKHKDLTP